MPAASAAETVDGVANPLYSVPIPPAAIASHEGDSPEATVREPADSASVPTASAIEAMLELPDFLDFSVQLENLHGHVHGLVGGTLGSIPWASYDPLFWPLQANVDRLWRIWQMRHPDARIPPSC